jgi:hypothetical protein
VIFKLITLNKAEVKLDNEFSSRNESESDMKKRLLNEIYHALKEVHPIAKSLTIKEDPKGAYTINKNKIHLCMNDPKNGRLYDWNTLMHVALHEMSHTLSNDIIEGEKHTDNFYKIFESLMDKAQSLGYYNKSNPPKKGYCKLHL